MARQILVPLSDSDRIEQFVPYIEQLAQPGTTVVFLVHYAVNGFKILLDQLLPFHTGIVPLPTSNRDLLTERQVYVERQTFSSCEALRQRGVKIVVNVYAGSLDRVVRQYMKTEDDYLLMMHPGLRTRVKQTLRNIGSRFFKDPSFPPVFLLHTGKQN